MVNKSIPALNNLLARVTLGYALFMNECLQKLFPADCDDIPKFIKDNEIHLRYSPVKGTNELWMNNCRVGTFSQRLEGTTFTFEFKT